MRSMFRGAASVAIGLSLVACAGDPPELHFDLVRGGGLHLMAYELARPDACAPRAWMEPGETSARSDVITCDTDDPATPTAWLGDVTVERGGQVLVRAAYDAWSGAILERDLTGERDLVVRISGDGDSVVIPLPDTEPPAAVIDDLSMDTEMLTASWHTVPAGGSAIAVVHYRNGGDARHVPAGAPASFHLSGIGGLPQWQPTSFSVQAFAPVVTVSTAFGDAHVWTAGTGASRDLPVQ